jgi:hypothetical protein
MEHGEPENEKVRIPSEERAGLEKERETKDDGRYIIFYTFEDEDEEVENARLDEEGSG